MEVQIERPDGSWVSVIVNIQALKNERGEITGAINCFVDVTERRRAELRLRMQFAVIQTLGEANDISEAIDRVLLVIADSLGCSVGLFWKAAHGGATLQVANSWCQPECQSFVDQSSRLRLKKGEGLPGRVWASGAPAYIADVTRDPNFPRADIAAREGLRGAPYQNRLLAVSIARRPRHRTPPCRRAPRPAAPNDP